MWHFILPGLTMLKFFNSKLEKVEKGDCTRNAWQILLTNTSSILNTKSGANFQIQVQLLLDIFYWCIIFVKLNQRFFLFNSQKCTFKWNKFRAFFKNLVYLVIECNYITIFILNYFAYSKIFSWCAQNLRNILYDTNIQTSKKFLWTGGGSL